MANEKLDLRKSKVSRASSRSGRAVVSVAFSREEFKEITLAAEAAGMKTSTFIRETVLDSLKQPRAAGLEAATGGSIGGSNFWAHTMIRVISDTNTLVETEPEFPILRSANVLSADEVSPPRLAGQSRYEAKIE